MNLGFHVHPASALTTRLHLPTYKLHTYVVQKGRVVNFLILEDHTHMQEGRTVGLQLLVGSEVTILKVTSCTSALLSEQWLQHEETIPNCLCLDEDQSSTPFGL